MRRWLELGRPETTHGAATSVVVALPTLVVQVMVVETQKPALMTAVTAWGTGEPAALRSERAWRELMMLPKSVLFRPLQAGVRHTREVASSCSTGWSSGTSAPRPEGRRPDERRR